MDKLAFKNIHKALLNEAIGKERFTKVYKDSVIHNAVANAYYESNINNIDTAYTDNLNSQVIIILKNGNPIFFYNDDGEKFYQLSSVNEVDGYLLFVLIKMLEKNYNIL